MVAPSVVVSSPVDGAVVTEAGAVVLPPMPAFYHDPDSIDDLIAQTTGKILDQFEIEHDLFKRWPGEPESP